MIQASIHGREYMNTQVAMRQLELFLRNYESGSYRNMTYEELLQGLCVHVIPMANPDGVTISQYGIEGIRDEECRQILEQCREADGAGSRDSRDYWKNWKANARGVDLNRNFDVGWQEFQGSLHPSSERYKGDVPASEAETQAILSIPERYPVVGCMAYHSSGIWYTGLWQPGSGVIWKTRNWHRQSARLQGMSSFYGVRWNRRCRVQ